MKILLNTCTGGFGLDENLAKDFCDQVGLPTEQAVDYRTNLNPEHLCIAPQRLWLCYALESNRTSPVLIKLVEEYKAAGKPVSYKNADIKVVEICDSKSWYIKTDYGKEVVVYLNENKEID